jgi:hypothetical protein
MSAAMEDAREKHLQKELADCVLTSSWFYCVAGLSNGWRYWRPDPAAGGPAAAVSLLLPHSRWPAAPPRLQLAPTLLRAAPLPPSAGVALAVLLGVKKKVGPAYREACGQPPAAAAGPAAPCV